MSDIGYSRLEGCHAIVLAGGAGRRMGARKEELKFGGEPLLLRLCRSLAEVAEEVTVVADRQRAHDFLPKEVRIVWDEVAGFGPIAGICAGISASALPLQLVVACDYPLAGPRVWRELGARMAGRPELDAIVPEAAGKLHPLCALYRRRTYERWEAALRSGNKRVMEAMRTMRIGKWQPEAADEDLLLNMNTPDDYRLAKERLGE